MKRLFVNAFCPAEHKRVPPPGFGVGPFCCARMELFAPPLADPRAPSVIPKRNELPLGNERVNLRAERRRFCWPKVIVDDQPALIVQQVAVAIQIPADVIVSIENEEAYLATG